MTNITQFSSIESKFMRNLHSYYSSSISDFLRESEVNIIGSINKNKTSAETVIQQDNAWEIEVEILKEQLSSFSEGRIMFEYMIQRVGKRVDVVVLHKNIVFLLEFKCGDTEYRSSTYDQVYDYALDLGNFHKESHNKLLVPIMISTRAAIVTEPIVEMDQFIQAIKYRVIQPIKCNATNIAQTIQAVAEKYDQPPFDYIAWENSEYLPSETIIEMAQLMYRSHNVNDIKQKGAKKKDLTVTTEEINKIIEYSKSHNRKSICFVTGVPGAGKTLVGLNIAIQHSNAKAGEHAVFLSGNYPLVQVLQEALARDKVEQEKAKKHKISKNDALRGTSAFIQIIHKYRDSFVGNDHVPPERVAIFDEAQRAWTKEKIANFMLVRKGVADFDHSEPEFLISTMDRHSGWAVVICLVGGGQEINTGEAGLPEWFDSLRRAFPEWDVYVTPQLNDEEYRRDREWKDMISNLNIHENAKLHLATARRSFRASGLAAFVKALLDVKTDEAKALYKEMKNKYPIVVTRNLSSAKNWVKQHCRGTARYGLLASSGGLRLKPEGIFVKNDIDVANWFLNGKDDVRSSYALEDVVTEFDIQGLELDYSILAWDADFRFNGSEWTYNNFSGNKWQNISNEDRKLYLKNAYRVLLTRAREGMVIFVPKGCDTDSTRNPNYYNETYEYLKQLGISELC